jgi:hypothetical protein
MPYQPLTPIGGICKVDSIYANTVKQGYTEAGPGVGRYTDMLAARFIAGRPEKKGGWTPLTSSTMSGICRGMKDWRDFNQNLYCGFGTNTKLYVYSKSITTLLNITPLRFLVTGTLTNPLTTNSTTTVSVAHTAHGLVSGDYVQLTSGTILNNITLANTYFVTVTDANNYTVTVPTAATGSTSGGGGTVSYIYYRTVLSSNPFTTVSGSPIVTVSHTSHGALSGDTVIITGGSAVGGLTLSGSYVILSTTTNTYTIMASSNASSSSTGGGTPNVQYEINIGYSSNGYGTGYGIGTYGSGTYGNNQVSNAYIVNARTWCLDNYGQQLLSNPYNGTIYIWDPTTYTSNNGRAYPMYGAPASGVLSMFVTPERFVFALGGVSNGLVVSWPDQSNYNNWTASITNTANSRTLQIGSYLVGGISARDGTSLVCTNVCAYAFNYSGDAFVYDSTATGRNSGLIGPLAICAFGGNVYWMGPNEFWQWNGTVNPIPSDDIRDYVYTNLNKSQSTKCFAVTNVSKKEVTFYYPVIGSDEITNSVTYHVDQGIWSIDTKSRTSQVDAVLFQYPISADASGNIWQEEYGTDANGSALDSYVVFSPTSISKGDRRCDIMGFMPDFERQTGACSVSILTQTYPEDPQTVVGPYNLGASDTTPLIDLRIGATLVGYKIESNTVGGDYRIGLCQADVNVAGARR